MALQVKELARRCAVTSDAIRYYTRIGLLQPVRDANNKYRLFNDEDLRRLNFIQRAKSLGYTLGEIKKIFEESRRGNSPCPMVRDIIQRRIEQTRRRLQQELKLQERMEQALRQWQDMADGVPDGHSICRLIESFDDDQGG